MFKQLWQKLFISATPEPIEAAEPDRPKRRGVFSTHDDFDGEGFAVGVGDRLAELAKIRPVWKAEPAADGMTSAMDAADSGGITTAKGYMQGQPNLSDALAEWFASQSFIGHQLAAIIAQHWLVAKVCRMPARDAIRHGFEIKNLDGDDLDEDLMKKLKRADKEYGLTRNMLEFLYFGRVFGIRICIFKVDYGDDETSRKAYEAPFNIDGVQPGAYKGMVQIDPYWCSPELDQNAAANPSSMHFYEPTWWNINGTRYHRSHLVIYRNGAVADILKPSYLYGGVPVPQLIMERVYGAERTANEAPLLALTKRTVVYKTDLAKALSNWPRFAQRVDKFAKFWTNRGIRVIDKEEDDHQQFDTSLADLDAMLMTQYQLVAAAGEVPGTKLLATQPKGFAATGEFDESSYHESLESIQEHDLTPLVERHHMLAIASRIPDQKGARTAIDWNPLDSPTAKEYAEIEKLDADRDKLLVETGAIDGSDIRQRLANAKTSAYSGIDYDVPAPEDVAPPPAPLAAPMPVHSV